MQVAELLALTPFILLATGGIIVLALGVWPRRAPGLLLMIVILTFLLAAAASAALLWNTPGTIAGFIIVDAISRLFVILFTLGAAGVVLLAYGYSPIRGDVGDEFLSLTLFATLGTALLACAEHLLTAFLGLEILAVPLFALTAWRPARTGAVEGGIKYTILAGVAAAFFLYGVALIYAATGSMHLDRLAAAMPGQINPIVLTGVALLLVGAGFKLAIVPFHMWAPDIYQAAPAPISAMFATTAKAAVLAFLIRLLTLQLPDVWEAMLPVIGLLAAATMITGNVLALLQNNLKRLLAYSSIAHIGYILVAFSAGNTLGREAAVYYAVAYVAMNLGAFGVIAALAYPVRDRELINDYRGLGRRHPGLGLAMAICLLALAGLPPTAGFMAKLLAFGAAIEAGQIALAVLAVLNTALSFYYYLRIILVFFSEKGSVGKSNKIPWSATLTIAVSTMAVIILGLFPSVLLNFL